MGVIAAVVLGAIGGAATGAVKNIPPPPGSGAATPPSRQPLAAKDVKAVIEAFKPSPKSTNVQTSQPSVGPSAGPSTLDAVTGQGSIKQPDRSRTTFTFPAVE